MSDTDHDDKDTGTEKQPVNPNGIIPETYRDNEGGTADEPGESSE